jgi:hypothetical protein
MHSSGGDLSSLSFIFEGVHTINILSGWNKKFEKDKKKKLQQILYSYPPFLIYISPPAAFLNFLILLQLSLHPPLHLLVVL